MRYAVATTIIALTLMVICGFTLFAFLGAFGADGTSFADIVATGMMFLSSLMISSLVILIFFIWIFSNQVDRLKNELDRLNKCVKDVQDDVSLLL